MATVIGQIIGNIIIWFQKNWSGILVVTLIAAGVVFVTLKIKDSQLSAKNKQIATQQQQINELTIEVSNISNRIKVENAYNNAEHSINSITNEVKLSEEVKNAAFEIGNSYLSILNNTN